MKSSARGSTPCTTCTTTRRSCASCAAPSQNEDSPIASAHFAKRAENPGKSDERRVPDGILPRFAETALEAIVLISPAWAQGAPAGASAPGYEQFFIIIGMFAPLYLLRIRPTMKRAKDATQMTRGSTK